MSVCVGNWANLSDRSWLGSRFVVDQGRYVAVAAKRMPHSSEIAAGSLACPRPSSVKLKRATNHPFDATEEKGGTVREVAAAYRMEPHRLR